MSKMSVKIPPSLKREVDKFASENNITKEQAFARLIALVAPQNKETPPH